MLQNFDLKKYINTVYELEKSLYMQETVRKKLQSEVNVLSKDVGILKEFNSQEPEDFGKVDALSEMVRMYTNSRTPYMRVGKLHYALSYLDFFESDVFSVFGKISLGAAILGFAIYMATGGNGLFGNLFSGFGLGIVFAIVAFLILTFFYSIINIFKYTDNKEKVNRANSKTMQENRSIIQANNIRFQERMLVRSNLQKELDHLNTVTIRETRELLEKYYSLGIVYYKYRNLTAISSFNEYLKSGRCTVLTGHEGAYNIYEEEIRLDRILTKLDVIIEKLDQIKNNQRMLYVAIKQAQNTSEDILREIRTIKNQNIDILNMASTTSHYSYITACNSQITAQNTEFLKWYHVINS